MEHKYDKHCLHNFELTIRYAIQLHLLHTILYLKTNLTFKLETALSLRLEEFYLDSENKGSKLPETSVSIQQRTWHRSQNTQTSTPLRELNISQWDASFQNCSVGVFHHFPYLFKILIHSTINADL
jgi:hypothetical protein